jgi:hypothetical protein
MRNPLPEVEYEERGQIFLNNFSMAGICHPKKEVIENGQNVD